MKLITTPQGSVLLVLGFHAGSLDRLRCLDIDS